MNEFFKSLAESMQKRVTTSILGTYATFWALLHWQTWYTTLFVSEETILTKFDLTKNEYLLKYFLGPRWDDWTFYLSYLLPALLTWLFIWVLPKSLFIAAFKSEREYKLAKRFIVLDGDTEFEKKREKNAKQTSRTLKAEKEVVREEQAIIKLDPETKLAQEFDEFMDKDDAEPALNELISTIYTHSGWIGHYGNRSNIVDSNLIAKVHSNGLAEFIDGASRIKLTDKGKYFISRYR